MKLEVDPQDKLRELARLLKGAPKELNREVTKALGAVTDDVKREILGRTEEFLPRRGGLARRVSRSKLKHRVTKSGKSPKVTITDPPDFQTLRDPSRVDRGRIAHPVFGMAYSRNPWQLQDVQRGWFSEPAADAQPLVKERLVETIDGFVEQVEQQL